MPFSPIEENAEEIKARKMVIVCDDEDREHEGGTMARVPDLEKFSKEHGVKLVTVVQIIEYKRRYDERLCCVGEMWLPTKFGGFRLWSYEARRGRRPDEPDLAGGRLRGYRQCPGPRAPGALYGLRPALRAVWLRRPPRGCHKAHARKGGEAVYTQHERRDTSLLDEVKAHCWQDERRDMTEVKGVASGHEYLKSWAWSTFIS